MFCLPIWNPLVVEVYRRVSWGLALAWFTNTEEREALRRELAGVSSERMGYVDERLDAISLD